MPSKPLKPSFRARREVAQLVAAGMPIGDIAVALGETIRSVRRTFPQELAHGAALCRAELIGLLWKAARKGNVAALRRLEEMTRLAHAAAKAQRPAERWTKRGEAKRQAEAAGSGGHPEWGDDLVAPDSAKH
jgi:hypothetical protein